MLVDQITSSTSLDTAYEWFCRQRAQYSHNSDVWDLRWNWEEEKGVIQSELKEGRYQLEALREYRFANERKAVWSARDAVVLKATSLALQPLIADQVSDCCTHLAGNGGSKGAVRAVKESLPDYQYVVRSDVKSYYASIDHELLLEQLRAFIDDEIVLDLLHQYMQYTTEFGGIYRENRLGICLGCPLSPLMGALYLKPLDDAMAGKNVFYRRYMDDWVILAKTRWQLRRAIRTMNRVLNQLKVEKHPDKTEINAISKGFTFLGYQFKRDSLLPAEQTLLQAESRAARLYEQNASPERIGTYWKNFWRWVKGGVGDILTMDALGGFYGYSRYSETLVDGSSKETLGGSRMSRPTHAIQRVLYTPTGVYSRTTTTRAPRLLASPSTVA